jgi:glycosyltransferase involved in cell wall biosynthesis
MCSRKEGMSNTVMESMAAGKPIVATPVGGNPELIDDGRTGFLVPVGEPDALASRIERIVADRALGKAMGLAGRAQIQALCSVDGMVASTARLYDELVRSAGIRPGWA